MQQCMIKDQKESFILGDTGVWETDRIEKHQGVYLGMDSILDKKK